MAMLNTDESYMDHIMSLPIDSNQSILKETNSEYSLEGLVLTLKLQYFGQLMWRLIGKDPDAGKDWRQEKGMTEDEMVGRHHWLL